jgi:hypothetical protein
VGPEVWSADPATLPLLNLKTQMTARYSAVNSRPDHGAIGGYGGYLNKNFHFKTPDNLSAPKGKLSIIVVPEPAVSMFDINQGTRFYIVNQTSSEVAFKAADSDLGVYQEALDDKGQWRRIELPMRYFCGNSFHKAFLPSKQCWQLAAPRYEGTFKTKLRIVVSDLNNNPPLLVSEPFDGSINPEQFNASSIDEETHNRSHITDG